ncbi:MAG: hypothetical protein IH845_00575 [Nanoarchaeota archaeon]|nr:hypothetical protein [Nanoarchaeota archaeon]
MREEKMEKIIEVLKKEPTRGFTITEMVKSSNLSRHIVLKTLTRLEGAERVSIRNAGMAKIYSLKKSSTGRRK